jgi:uncharacterized protein (TIGR00255 family)
MALSGMTGFGRAEGERGGVAWTWEIKSVNGRGLDVRVRTPAGLDALEPGVREAVAKRLRRGAVTASLQVRREAAQSSARINAGNLQAIIAAARPFIEKGVVDPPGLDGLLALKGVLEVDEAGEDADEEAALRAAMLASLEPALAGLDQARRSEGAALAKVLADAVDRIESLSAAAVALAAVQPDAIRERLRARIDDLIGGAFPEERLATEAALLATKADVREELDRLAAHVATARELMAGKEPAGRKLDFLSQELNREANTLCAKSSDGELTRIGLDLKATIDQFREQVQNVE